MPLAATRGEFPELIISYRIEVREQIEMVERSLNKLQSLKNDLQQNSWGAQISTNDREIERETERDQKVFLKSISQCRNVYSTPMSKVQTLQAFLLKWSLKYRLSH